MMYTKEEEKNLMVVFVRTHTRTGGAAERRERKRNRFSGRMCTVIILESLTAVA